MMKPLAHGLYCMMALCLRGLLDYVCLAHRSLDL